MNDNGPESDLTPDLSAAGDAPDVAGQVNLEIFVSPDCPNCPHTVRAAKQLAAANQHVRVTVLDVTEHPQKAADIGVRSVPLTLVNGEFTLVGVVSVEQLADAITSAAGAGDAAILRSMIDAGRFGAAGRMLIDGRGREGYINLWRTSSLENRIGLVLTAEGVLAEHPLALDAMVGDLVEMLGTEDAARRGDTADLLGMIGHPGARPALESLLSDEVADVAEIASDALESLRSDPVQS